MGLSSAQTAHADGKLALPDVKDAPTETIDERGESPVYYRLPDNTFSGWFRSTLGASSRLAVAGELEQTRFSLDVLGGAELGFDRTSPATMVTELGYSYVYESQHWFMVGLGPGLRRLGGSLFEDEGEALRPMGHAGITLIPHGIIGDYEGNLAYGVRTSLLARYMTLGLEVAHQYARIPAMDRHVHEIHFGVTMIYSGGDFD